MPLYASLPPDLRDRLHGLIQIFMREKKFVGCNDLIVTDEMRLVIAGVRVSARRQPPGSSAHAFLRRPVIDSGVPDSVHRPQTHHDEDGVVTEGDEVLSGQAWDSQRIILSWQDVEESAAGEHNVVLHEFAHYLDMEDETMDGAPGLGDARAFEQWSETFWEEYERLCDDVDAGKATFLDPYAATEPAEFFAVVTEAFFMQPRELEAEHAGLYTQLRKYYRLDPARWPADHS